MPKLNRRRIRELVRQFKENGMKMLLEHPANVRDMLRVLHARWLNEIDFTHLEQIKTTFIRRDYRHLESDIVLRAPLSGGARSHRKLLIYILIEHQSEPDRLMPLRLADAQLQIFRYQVRTWSQAHGSAGRGELQLQPVLPVVFYTGLRHWPHVGTLADLIERGNEFRPVTPIVERPLFLNLPDVGPGQLEHDGGYFGSVLRLVQQRESRPDEFEQLLQRVVTHLETMSSAERVRCRDLLSYIGALVYHERSEEEHRKLHERIESSVQNAEIRREVREMGKTMADVLIDKGRSEAGIETRQQTLVRLLRRRFRKVPASVARTVQATTDVDQLDTWLDRFATASTIDELEIPTAT